jgi:hypothetical protein
LFFCRTHHCIDQTCSAELAKAMIDEQWKCDAATAADRPCHPDAQTFAQIGAGTKAVRVQQERPGCRDEPNDEAANRQTARLGGMAITLLLPVVSLLLVRELRDKEPIENCLIAGRVNCNLLAATPSDPSATIS